MVHVAARTYAIIGAGIVAILIAVAAFSYSAAPEPKGRQGSFWTEGAPMPTPRTEIAGAAIDNIVYIVGGFDAQGRAVATVEVYNSSNDSWSAVAPMPQPLHHAAAASLGEKLYVVGGYFANNTSSDRLYVYDPKTDKWQDLSSMPTARGALTAQFVNGTLYAIGGVSTGFGSAGVVGTNEAYDPATDRWEEKEPMPTPREHLASASYDNELYIIGGRVGGLDANLDANEMYDPAEDKWTELAAMPSKRGGLAAAASPSDGRIYVFGGESPTGTFRNNERYSPHTSIWESAPEMPNGRHGLAAVGVENEIYVIGGGPQPGLTVSDSNQILHIPFPRF
jgi:N-acetylneuraminic acid mutarotase